MSSVGCDLGSDTNSSKQVCSVSDFLFVSDVTLDPTQTYQTNDVQCRICLQSTQKNILPMQCVGYGRNRTQQNLADPLCETCGLSCPVYGAKKMPQQVYCKYLKIEQKMGLVGVFSIARNAAEF